MTRLRRHSAEFTLSSLTLASSLVACSHGGPGASEEAGSAILTALSVSSSDASPPPVELVPAFSSAVHDYYVRCAPGTNALTVSMTAGPGALGALVAPGSSRPAPSLTFPSLHVDENQAIVASASSGGSTTEYWVRCLPHEFPLLQMVPHPEVGKPTPGYYLVGTRGIPGGSSGFAIMLNGDGVPVWYAAATGGVGDVDDFGKESIGFFSSHGDPATVYRLDPFKITSVAPSAMPLDWHELQVLPNGNYLAISSPVKGDVDLTGLKARLLSGEFAALGAASNIVQCTVVEFKPSGEVVWTWKATDHFDPVQDSIEAAVLPNADGDGALTASSSIDTFHCNSIDVDPSNGNLLVSARQMDSVFYVEKSTGKVLWKMGGAAASLDHATYIPVASPFYGQHDARLQPGWSTCKGGQVTLFDDHTFAQGPARGVVYDVSLGSGDAGAGECGALPGASATVAWEYDAQASSEERGSFRILPDGSHIIGWGSSGTSTRVFTELDGNKNDLLDFYFPELFASYRAIKVPLSAFDLQVLRSTAGR